MGSVVTEKPSHTQGQLTISDLTSKYQQKIDNYNLMIGLMSEEQKKIFQIAINLYDIQLRQNHWDSYVGYALNALARSGWYYNVMTAQWMPCNTPELIVKTDPNMSDQRAYEEYLEKLYPREACQMLGISRWEIMDMTPDMNSINLAAGGEMEYENYDLSFDVEYYELGGEQKGNAKNKVERPDIPISPNIDVAELTKGDKSNDKFIYAYTDSGLSKNKRNWRPMIMDRIAQQVMDQNPPGNMGHVNPKNVGYELPLPVITWIGAMTVLQPDGTKRLWLKGYIIPTDDGANLKTYIRAKAINSISVYGGLTLLPNAETGTQDVLDIDLKSIDISGKLKEGLNSGITELAGEMANPIQSQMPYNQNNNNVEMEENKMGDLRSCTLAELKSANPQLFGEMKADIIASMKMEESQKVVMTKAGEMDALTSQMGGNPTEMFKQYQTFAGEMAEAVGIMPQAGMQMPTMAEIGAKVKEMVGNLGKLTEILKPATNQTAEAKATELVQQNQLAQNTKAVQDANAKFAELTKDISNEAVKNLVSLQFNGILQAKPESLPEGYAQSSIQTLEAQVPEAIKSVVANAQTLMQNGQAAGEMAAFANLGVGSGASANQKDVSNMSDTEYAKYLGYEF